MNVRKILKITQTLFFVSIFLFIISFLIFLNEFFSLASIFFFVALSLLFIVIITLIIIPAKMDTKRNFRLRKEWDEIFKLMDTKKLKVSKKEILEEVMAVREKGA